MALKKYFIAIIIPPPLSSEIENIKQELFAKHNLKGALRSPAHITLHRPFEWKEEKENILIEKLKSFEFKKSFDVEVNGFSFFEPRVIYVVVSPNETLNELHAQLTHFAKRELNLFNEAEDMRGFHQHITVAFRDLKKPKFYELQKEFLERKLHGNFAYEGFVLLKLEEKWKIL